MDIVCAIIRDIIFPTYFTHLINNLYSYRIFSLYVFYP